jgi:hypothetical protein
MWVGVKNSGSRRRTNSPTRRDTMNGNGSKGEISQRRKNPNNFKARVSNPNREWGVLK